MGKWQVKYNTDLSRSPWNQTMKDLFGERNEGKVVECETEKEAKQKFNALFPIGKQVGDSYLKATKISNVFQNGRMKAMNEIQNKLDNK